MLIFAVIMFMYAGIIIWMYDPKLNELLNSYQDMMPGFMAAMGMNGDTGTLLSFINTYLYGMLYEIVPLIFVLMLINRLLVRPIDNGSLACLMASPHSRSSIIVTLGTVVVLLTGMFVVLCTLFGLMVSELVFPGELNIAGYFKLNGAVLLLHMAISGFCFCIACLIKDSKPYLGFCAGVPLVMYLFQSLSAMNERLDWLRYISVFSLFPASEIVTGTGEVLLPNLMLLFIALVTYIGGGLYFIKRDLSL